MNIQDVEQRFGQLKQQHDAGTLSVEDFDREREQLKAQDAQGRWWTKSEAGRWFVHDGSQWVPGSPYGSGAQDGYGSPGSYGAPTSYGAPNNYGAPNHPQGGPGYPPPAYGTYQGGGAPTTSGGTSASTFFGLAVACAIVSLFLLPIVLGPLGFYFGNKAEKMGDARGQGAKIAALVCAGIGIVLALVLVFGTS